MRSWTSCLSRGGGTFLLAGALLFGCSRATVGITKATRPGPPRPRIAVLPFQELGASATPRTEIRAALLEELKAGGVEIVEQRALEEFMARHRVRYTGGIDQATAAAMREELGTEAVLMTTIDAYRAEFPPKLSLSSRLVATGPTAEILWIDSAALSGDASPGVLGLGLIRDPGELARKATGKLARSLLRRLSGESVGSGDGNGRKYLPETVYRSPAYRADFRPYTVGFSLPSSRRKEGSGTVSLPVILSAPSTRAVTVDWGALGGTASGSDYRAAGGTLRFAPGETEKAVEVVLVDDSLDEQDETVEIGLFRPVNAVAGGVGVHTLTIEDDDPAPEVTFERTEQSADERAGSVSVRAVLSAVSGKDVSVPFAVGGDAVAGSDYRLATESPLAIRAGSQSAGISLVLLDDSASEGEETVSVIMGVPENASPGAVRTHTITIADDDHDRVIAVLPFNNLSPSRNAGELVAVHFVRQLSRFPGIRIVEPGEVRDKLLGLRVIMDDGISLANTDLVFERLQADLILTGRVLDYGESAGAGTTPVVDFSVLMIERSRRETVWLSRSRNRGDDGVYLFDWGMVKSADELAGRMAESVVRQMMQWEE